MRVHFDPPSRETNTPLPGPPLNIAHVCISTCQVPANSVRGLLGSIARPEQPVFSSTNRTRSQCWPPSVVRKTPRSCCGPVVRPTAQTKTISGFLGWTSTLAIRPVSSSPMCDQVWPASTDL